MAIQRLRNSSSGTVERTDSIGRSRTKRLRALVSALGLAIAIPGGAFAAVFSCGAGDVPCLIAAINTANQDSDADTINLAAGTYTLTEVNNQVDGQNGLPSITGTLVIRGAGASVTVIQRDPSIPEFSEPTFRIVHVGEGSALTIEALTIRNGAHDDFPGGGGIYNRGTTTVVDGVIAGNTAIGRSGGGIENVGTLILRSSRVEGNNAGEGAGGGISNSGTLTVDHSSINSNFADFAGGIFNDGTITTTYSTISGNGASNTGGIWSSEGMTIANSTIVGNKAQGLGPGGILVGGSATIENSTIAGNSCDICAAGGIKVNPGGSLLINDSTIADNSAAGGGGLQVEGGTAQLQNTILARNFCAVMGELCETPGSDCLGQATSLGHNVVGDPSGCTITLLASDHTGDPGLSSFLDDGTPGNGHFPPLETSQAVDAGDPVSCTLTDQLGHSRIDGDRDGVVVCDIGAIEFSPAATIVSDLASLAQVVTASKRTRPQADRLVDSQSRPPSPTRAPLPYMTRSSRSLNCPARTCFLTPTVALADLEPH